ncbi:MAG: NAD-dependent epimerase/dehydratase family protein [Polyangiaceae bacterium]
MQRIVVVGGNGYLGSRCVRALRALGVEVSVASRRGELRVDLSDPSTFENLAGADVIVDLADTTTHAPDELARFCLGRGLVLVEGTSDPPAIRRIHEENAGKDHAGAVVLGAGIFTGVSNLLARAAARGVANPESIELAISSSPYSGAGQGTVALMVAGPGRAASRFADGARRDEPAIARGPKIEFPGVTRPTLRLSFAEQEMLGPSLGVPNTDVLFAPRPALLVPAFLMLPGFLVRSAIFRLFMGAYFAFLRRVLLRSTRSRVEMVATARSDKDVARRTAVAEDGMAAGGNAAAAIALLVARAKRPRGVVFVDQVVALDAVVELANRVADASDARIELGSARAVAPSAARPEAALRA